MTALGLNSVASAVITNSIDRKHYHNNREAIKPFSCQDIRSNFWQRNQRRHEG